MTAELRAPDKARSYPRKVEITRAVSAARESGIDVAGIRVGPDGSITIFDARSEPQKLGAYDLWEDRL